VRSGSLLCHRFRTMFGGSEDDLNKKCARTQSLCSLWLGKVISEVGVHAQVVVF
jgi:hypothetical protein